MFNSSKLVRVINQRRLERAFGHKNCEIWIFVFSLEIEIVFGYEYRLELVLYLVTEAAENTTAYRGDTCMLDKREQGRPSPYGNKNSYHLFANYAFKMW